MNTYFIIEYFVKNGVPLDTVVLILMLPIIATLIAFFRQVFGVKAFGIYTPSIITFAFLAIGHNSRWNGVKYGTTIFIGVIFVGMVTRFILKKFRLLYLPRLAITLSIVALSILLMLVLGGTLHRTGLASVSIFPLLIMITIVEKFVAAQIEKGTRTAVILALETLFISLFGYFVASWDVLIKIILNYPWIILLTFPLNFILGKWTGLRVVEYWRFKEILKRN